MTLNDIREFTFAKVIPVVVYVGLALVLMSFAVTFLGTDVERDTKMASDDPYETAQNYIDNGNLNDALATYSRIIDRSTTSSGGEETAWHEKGKLLIRLGYCNEAMNHYSNYVYKFTDSVRADEGFKLAKQC